MKPTPKADKNVTRVRSSQKSPFYLIINVRRKDPETDKGEIGKVPKDMKFTRPHAHEKTAKLCFTSTCMCARMSAARNSCAVRVLSAGLNIHIGLIIIMIIIIIALFTLNQLVLKEKMLVLIHVQH